MTIFADFNAESPEAQRKAKSKAKWQRYAG